MRCASSSRHCVQRHEQPAGAVAQRVGRAVATSRRRSLDGRDHVDRRRHLRRTAQHAAVRQGRLSDSRRSCSTSISSSWPPRSGATNGWARRPARGHSGRTRVEEVHRGAVGAGRVALGAVQELELRAVRAHRVEVDLVVRPGVLPAAEHDATVVEHGRIEVVALVERDLAQARAVGVHHVQHERRLAGDPRPARRTAACPRRAGSRATGAGASS